jgi:hypothetical protein
MDTPEIETDVHPDAISVVCREILQLSVEDEAHRQHFVGITVDRDWWDKATPIAKQLFWQGLATEARPKLLEKRRELAAALLEQEHAELLGEADDPTPVTAIPAQPYGDIVPGGSDDSER